MAPLGMVNYGRPLGAVAIVVLFHGGCRKAWPPGAPWLSPDVIPRKYSKKVGRLRRVPGRSHASPALPRDPEGHHPITGMMWVSVAQAGGAAPPTA